MGSQLCTFLDCCWKAVTYLSLQCGRTVLLSRLFPNIEIWVSLSTPVRAEFVQRHTGHCMWNILQKAPTARRIWLCRPRKFRPTLPIMTCNSELATPRQSSSAPRYHLSPQQSHPEQSTLYPYPSNLQQTVYLWVTGKLEGATEVARCIRKPSELTRKRYIKCRLVYSI